MLLAALLALAAAPSAAETERLHYTPTTCSTDAEGKVYLRLNTGVAFGFPADALTYFRGEIDFEPPPVPNPDDPEGCPGNPITTPGAHVLFDFPRPAETLTEGFAPDIRLLLKIGGASARSFDENGLLWRQGSALRLFRMYRSVGNWCELTAGGWEVCYPDGVREKPKNPRDFGAIYLARESNHTRRSEAPLFLECWPPHLSGRRECSTIYQPLPRVKVSLRFYDDLIPVNQFFAIDRAITEWLEATRVPALDFEPPAHVLHRPEKDR
jgi:hypothetical protein